MSGTTISQLPAALSVIQTDLLPVVEVGTPNVTKRLTIAQLLANTISTTGGVFTGPIEFDQGITLDNNQYIDWRDISGTAQPVMALDNSNNVVLKLPGTGLYVQSGGANVASIDNAGDFSGANVIASGTVQGAAVNANGVTTNALQVNGAGTVTGNLTVAGNIYPGGSLINIGGVTGFDIYQSGGTPAIQLYSGNYIALSGGNMVYATTGYHLFSGDVRTTSNFVGGTASLSGALDAASAVISGGSTVGTEHVTGSFAADGPSTFNNTLTVGSSLTVSGSAKVGANGITYTAVDTHAFEFWYNGGNGQLNARIDGATDVVIGTVSDARFKTDVASSTFDALAAICRVPLFGFRWKGDDDAPGEATPIGFVAQELAAVFPEAVADTGKNLAINTNTVLAAMVGAVQQLAARVAGLEAKLAPAMKA